MACKRAHRRGIQTADCRFADVVSCDRVRSVIHVPLLKRVVDGKRVEAAFQWNLLPQDLKRSEGQWQESRQTLRRSLTNLAEPGNARPESLDWDWSTIPTTVEQDNPAETMFCGLFVEDECEGLIAMTIGTNHGFSQLELKDENRHKLVFVEFLETAPWNWKGYANAPLPRYRGVGPQLLRLAIEWSVLKSFEGRVALESLVQAEEFYEETCRMNRIGTPDLLVDSSVSSYTRFEWTPAGAKKFLAGK